MPAVADPPKPSDSYVQSFARGLGVIRSFGAGTPSQTLSEVATRTGLTRAGDGGAGQRGRRVLLGRGARRQRHRLRHARADAPGHEHHPGHRQPAPSARTVVDIEALMAEIARVRDQGWCFVNQELESGLASLAAPLIDRSGRTLAALNLSAQVVATPPEQMLQRCLPPLRAAAQRISHTLQMKA